MARTRHDGRRRRKSPEMPVGSFSDIAFLLIIFFIIATTMDKMIGFVTDIPAGEKSDAQTAETPTIQLLPDRVVFNKEDVDMPTLRKRLSGLKLAQAQDEEGRIVLLEAKGNVDYQSYFETMSAISKAGGVVAIVKEDEDK